MTNLKTVFSDIAIFCSGDRAQYRWVRRWHRRLSSMPLALKWLVAIGSTALIGFADMLSDREAIFSILYVFPTAYGTWFLGTRAGLIIGFLAGAIWIATQWSFAANSPNRWIPVWNVSVGCFFLLIIIIAIARTKRSAARMQREIQERTRSLQDEAGRRRKLEQELIETSARQQLRLAQDLHDGLGQYLSALTFHSRLLADDLQQQQSPHATQAARLCMLIRKTNQVTRQLNGTLQVPEARNGGLVAACRSLAIDFEQLTGVRCQVEVEQDPPSLDDFRTIMLFRVVQEAFNNSVKHARPQNIRVTFAVREEDLVLSVVNDGHDESAIEEAERGTGAIVMRLRAELIGARFDAGPAGAGDYKVECILPIKTAPSAAGSGSN